MNHQLYHLRNIELEPSLASKLSPFISAYKPHDQPPTKKDMDSDDYIPQESPLSKENIIDTYKALKYNKDLEWLKIKREYNKKWQGYRTHYNL
jgi:hypothetical protein